MFEGSGFGRDDCFESRAVSPDTEMSEGTVRGIAIGKLAHVL